MNYKTDWKSRPYTGSIPNYKPLRCSCGRLIESITPKGKSEAIDLPCDCTLSKSTFTDKCFYFDCLFNVEHGCRKGLKGEGIPKNLNDAKKNCFKERMFVEYNCEDCWKPRDMCWSEPGDENCLKDNPGCFI